MRDATLESRAAREKLKPRGKPYYKAIGPSLHLGYRKGKSGGRWVVRLYVGDRNYRVETVADADDRLDANGGSILDFWQAQEKARELHTKQSAAPEPAALTVRQAVEAYIAMRDARESRRKGRAVRSDASRRLHRYVLGQDKRGKQEAVPASALADMAMAALTDDDLAAWRAGLSDTLKETTKRRLANDLKAALHTQRKQLNAALVVNDGLKGVVADDEAEPVARDNQILSDAQIMRLLDAARQIDAELGWDGDLFRLVSVLNATGARFSQIARMKVRDCQLAEARLLVPSSRKGKAGKSGASMIPVEPAVIDVLRPAVAGRAGDAPLLERWRHRQTPGSIRWVREGRGPWQSSSDMDRAWKAIRERAGMPGVIAYALRHSSIVRGIRQNLPIRLVAAAHDTSVAMIEKHYAKWITSGLEEMARLAIVPLMPAPATDGKVVRLDEARRS
ncbi:tyrosine-type recombinase/integrase [Allomesorhizobium alhagi]|uniref:tyrosine-type recombinase/integrase n=1 Tax=Allomesorhizobium alhagi TaxID=475067 RepID=UPI001FCABB58|nr:tyrosine-type recombinase/integrase [Mesorhizobium alhagi]